MTRRLAHLGLVIALGVMPGATSLALIDSRQGPDDAALLLMQRHSAQTTPLFSSAAHRQAELERRNQEVRETLSQPPRGWEHYDHPPALNVPAAPVASQAPATTPPDNGWWWMLLGSLLLGAGITFAATLFMRRQVPAAPGEPKQRIARHIKP